MKIADLYIRVSTDEQADTGYSQRSQEEFLRKYCDINNISIRKVIFEDDSAKTFNRPEWKKYLLDFKQHKNKSDFVLFLKWDRFSRNAVDAYQMINMQPGSGCFRWKKKNYRLKVVSNESLPLRGFLICPLCNKLLTGSASKGHTKYYSYYHCTDGCSCRYRADNANTISITELKKYVPRLEMIDLFKITLSEAWYDQTNHLQDDSKQLRLKIR